MKPYTRNSIVFIFLIGIYFILFSTQCNSGSSQSIVYKNHAEGTKYVGMNTCKTCHPDKYETFIHTGMGLSFGAADTTKSSAVFGKHALIYDSILDYYYQAFVVGKNLYIKEYRLENGDTIHSRIEKIDYVIGSGQHTNSHIFQTNGYYFQMPMTFYTQVGKWDFPPGYENGFNARFNRTIELECMSCHNAYPSYIPGSKNKYASILEGIDCERCHGPGEIHVTEKSKGILVDTANEIDYSIVNPKKLPYDLQVDVCQRCHLQGNAVLNEGKSFFDFKPGQKLSDYMNVFLPRYENESSFIMASHADRLKQSKCFIESANKKIDLNQKKYTNAQFTENTSSSLTCITCHNPHVSVKVTGRQVLNNPCIKCHENSKMLSACTEKESVRALKNNDCSGCHMPSTGTIDIPHVSVHDHKIQIPIQKSQQESIKKFIGLAAINNPNPNPHTKAEAYINYFEKFENKAEYLDSADYYFKMKGNYSDLHYFNNLVHLYFLKNDFKKIIELVEQHSKGYTKDAWTLYRIGEAYESNQNLDETIFYYRLATEQAPYILEFRNKLGSAYIDKGNMDLAKKEFDFILKENPNYVPAISNLAYIYLLKGDASTAKSMLTKALKLDPDYEFALFNMASASVMENKQSEAIVYIKRVLKRNPKNTKALMALEKLKNE